MKRLKQQDCKIVAMTLNDQSVDLEEIPIERKLALCFGTEETGLSRNLIDLANYCVRIPMQGFTQSFNISVSAGISLFPMINKLHDSSINWQLDANEKTDLYIDWLVKSTPNGEALMKHFLQEQSGLEKEE